MIEIQETRKDSIIQCTKLLIFGGFSLYLHQQLGLLMIVIGLKDNKRM